MKTLKMLVLVVATTFSSVLTASTDSNETADPASINETVGELLKNPDTSINEKTPLNIYFFCEKYD